MRPRQFTFLVLPLVGLFAGCQTGDIAKRIPISGGGEIVVPLTRDGLKPGSADGYEVLVAALAPGKEREALYKFAMVAHKDPALRRIEIEDISDETAAKLVDDPNPKFEKGVWTASTEMISADDPRMKWVYQIPGSMRVYHFTLTRKDGTQVSFNHVTMYAPVVKTMMRSHWGEKY